MFWIVGFTISAVIGGAAFLGFLGTLGDKLLIPAIVAMIAFGTALSITTKPDLPDIECPFTGRYC